MYKKLMVFLVVLFGSAAVSAKDLIKISVSDASGEKFALAVAPGNVGYFSLDGDESYAVKPSIEGEKVRVDFFRLSEKGKSLAKARDVVPASEMARVESGFVRGNSEYQLGLHGFRLTAEKTTRERLMAFTERDKENTRSVADEFSLSTAEGAKQDNCPVVGPEGLGKGTKGGNGIRAEACCVSCRPDEWVCADCVVRPCGSCCGG